MKAGYNGRIAVFWSQTETDGLEGAPLADLTYGAAWSWHGRVTRLLDVEAQYSEPAGYDVAMTTLAGHLRDPIVFNPVAQIATIVLTNGAQSFEAQLTRVEGQKDPVLLFENGCPASGQEFWVCKVQDATDSTVRQTGHGNVVSFPAAQSSTPQALVLPRQVAATAAE